MLNIGMRDLIDIIQNANQLGEGEIVDLRQHKTDRVMGDYLDAIQGLVNSEADFFFSGKFAPFAKSYIDNQFDPKFAPQLSLDIKFRDPRPNEFVRALKQELRASRFKIEAPVKWAKGARPMENTNEDQWGGWATKAISLEDARRLFDGRETSHFGAYQPSRMGFRTSHQNIWDKNGVGFSLTCAGFDGRRDDKYGNPERHEEHIIDNDADMQEISHMFALIRRAKMISVK